LRVTKFEKSDKQGFAKRYPLTFWYLLVFLKAPLLKLSLFTLLLKDVMEVRNGKEKGYNKDTVSVGINSSLNKNVD